MIGTLVSLWEAVKNGASALCSKRVYAAIAIAIVICSLKELSNFQIGCIVVLGLAYIGSECWYKYLNKKYGDK